MDIPDHLTCLLRNLYSFQEATVRTGRGTTDWFQIRKGVCQGYILSPCLFNLYVEYIMRNAGLDKPQAGTKIPGRTINNTSSQICQWQHPYGRKWRRTKEPLDKTKRGEWKIWLKLIQASFNIQKRKIMASGPITSGQIDGETMATVTNFILGGPLNHCRWWLQSWN